MVGTWGVRDSWGSSSFEGSFGAPVVYESFGHGWGSEPDSLWTCSEKNIGAELGFRIYRPLGPTSLRSSSLASLLG